MNHPQSRLIHVKIYMEPTCQHHSFLILHSKGHSKRQCKDLLSGSSHRLIWPTLGEAPINEFTSEGYISLAFPTLFPTGAADFLGQCFNQVTIGNYFTHLLKYDDGRFAKHPRFRFFALNTEMRRRALQAGRIYVQQNPGDAQLTVDDLRDMVGRGGEAFSNRVLRYATSLRGTRQYWFKQRGRLISILWSPLVYPQSSLHTAQQICNGQS